MEYSRNILVIAALVSLACHSYAAPTRRSRAAFTEAPTTARENKLQEDFKEPTTTTEAPKTNRKNKALNLFGFYPSFLSSGFDYTADDDDINFTVNDENFEEEELSRTIPTRRRQQNKKKNGNGDYQNDNINSLQYENSPIFYIRLPPTPYMFVPGLGYVSQPPSLGPPMAPMMPPAMPPQVADPFINLPIDFVSNGKPTGVYQWSGGPSYPQVPQMPSVDPFGYGPQPMMPSRPSYNIPSYSQPKPKPVPSNSKLHTRRSDDLRMMAGKTLMKVAKARARWRAITQAADDDITIKFA